MPNIPPFVIVLIVIAAVLVAAIIILYFLGKKAEKKKAEQDEQIAAAAQQITMLVIDKKKLRIQDSGLPQAVIDQSPKLAKLTKLPIVKAKVGPRIMTFIAEASVFDIIPVKKEVKATVSGLYITAVKGLRGTLEKPQKKTFRQKLMDKANSLRGTGNAPAKGAPAKGKKKK